MVTSGLPRAALALVAGLAVGLASAHWAMSSQPEQPAPGGTIWRAIGSGDAKISPYALAASLAEFRLPPPQSLEFIASRDSGGRTLYGDCTYHLRMPTTKARWWIVQLLPPGERNLAASHSIVAEPEGVVEIAISRRPQPGNWIAPGEAAPFRAILTLATPPREQAGETTLLPDIERIDCK
jgi:hypothetical protein